MKLNQLLLQTNKEIVKYSEEPQYSYTKFSLLEEISLGVYKELHSPVKCREFLSDAVVESLLGSPLAKIYGFQMETLLLRHSLDISFSFPNKDLNRVLTNLKILKDAEDLLGVSCNSYIYIAKLDVEREGLTTLIIESPKEWASSPLAMSLYSFILRLCWYNLGTTITLKDCYEYFKSHNSSGCNDFRVISKISYLEIETLLKNLIDITVENPITGINDNYLKDNVSKLQESPYDEILLPFISEKTVKWSVKFSHGFSGFSSVIALANNIKNNQEYKQIGYQWAVNFNNIMEKLS